MFTYECAEVPTSETPVPSDEKVDLFDRVLEIIQFLNTFSRDEEAWLAKNLTVLLKAKFSMPAQIAASELELVKAQTHDCTRYLALVRVRGASITRLICVRCEHDDDLAYSDLYQAFGDTVEEILDDYMEEHEVVDQ